MFVTKADLGRHAGVTKQAINKAINSNRIPVKKHKGKEVIDLDDPIVLTYITECNARLGRTWEPPVPPQPVQKPLKVVIPKEPPLIIIPKVEPPKREPDPEPEIEVKEEPEEPEEPPFIPPPPEPQRQPPQPPRPPSGERVKAPLKGLAAIPKAELDKWHKYEQALKVQADREYTRGELIERKLVQQIFSKIYSIDKSEFCTMGAKLSPDIAAIMEVNDPAIVLRITERIDRETYKVLSHIQRLVNDYLESIGGDKIE